MSKELKKKILICLRNGIAYPIIATSYLLLGQFISILNIYTCNEYSVFALLKSGADKMNYI